MFRWQGGTTVPQPIKPVAGSKGKQQLIAIPFASDGKPGISGNIRFVVSPWNS